MTTKRENTRPRSSGKKKTETNKTTKKRKGTSKKITYWIFAIAVAFIVWACWIMTKTQDLSPLEYIANIIETALPIGIIAYMFRAVMEDKMELQLKYNRSLSEDKKKYGDNYIIEELDMPDFLNRG